MSVRFIPLFAFALLSGAAHAAAPTITSTPDTIAVVTREYRYDVDASDADNDRITYARSAGAASSTIDAASGLLRWTPTSADIGSKSFTVTADDGRGGRATQSFDLRVVERFCALYPIAIPQSAIANLASGSVVAQLPRGTGAGNYSWLSWTGGNSAPTLANSLLPPGDSYTYVNRDAAADKSIDIGDWVQGGPGAMNASAVRNAMDALKSRDIIVPTFSTTRGQGSGFDYKVAGFITIRLRDYQLNGHGWLSFEYRGAAQCYGRVPTATAQSVTTNEDTAKAITLAGTDADGDAITFVVASQPEHGTLTGTVPQLTYTPRADYHGSDRFTFIAKDATGESARATVAITIASVNDTPLASAQSVTTNEDTAKTITLTGMDVDGQSLTYAIAAEPANGTLTGTSPTFIYTPAADFHGGDRLTFTANDGTAASLEATVAIDVTPVNDAPIARAQAVTTDRGVASAITLAASDADGDPLTYRIDTAPTHGQVVLAGAIATYTPTAGYSGDDRFTFIANDGHASSTAAAIEITVNATNDAPHANPQTLTVTEDQSLDMVMTGTDPDGDALTFVRVQDPQHGTLTNEGNDWNYLPDPDYHGADSFTFKANDGEFDSEAATVTLNVQAVNDEPVAESQQVDTERDVPVAIELVARDVDGEGLTYARTSGPTHGQLSGTLPHVTYTPAIGYAGDDTFEFKVTDAAGAEASAVVRITINATNRPPVASGQRVRTDRDTALTITLQATDADANVLTYRVATAPLHGDVIISGNEARYEPTTGYAGTDRFTFIANDGEAESQPAAIDIDVVATNRAPVALAQDVQTPRDTAVAVTLTGTDIDGDALTYRIVTQPTHGQLTMTGNSARYTPAAGYAGPDSFSFVVNDGTVDSSPASIEIDVAAINRAPVANPQTIETARDTAKTITLTGTDADGNPLTYRLTTNPTHGAAVLSGSAVTYTPTAGYTGTDTFAFVANDGIVDSAPASITIEITGQNAAPAITSTPITAVDENAAYRYSVDATDPDGDALSYTADRLPNGLAIGSTSGLIDGTPTAIPTQSVQALNTQCYLIPEGARAVGGNGSRTYIAPLYERIVTAIEHGSDYLVPKTVAWGATNDCLGCHVQTQATNGLQAAAKKAEIDTASADRLLDELIAAQHEDGSIHRNDARFLVTQTALALWSLDEARDRARTRETRRRALAYLYAQRSESTYVNAPIMFWKDYDGSWMGHNLSGTYGLTALITKAAGAYIAEVEADRNATAAQRAVAAQYRAAMSPIAFGIYHFMLQQSQAGTLVHAMQIVAVAHARPYITEPARIAAIDATLPLAGDLLRARQRDDGGWALFNDAHSESDPLATAWVGFAFDALQAPVTDPSVMKLIEYLLAKQNVDGSWAGDNRVFQTQLAGTGLVVAYLPTALEHFGNADLTVGDLAFNTTDGVHVLSAQVRNRGIADLRKPIRVRFHQGATLLGETTLERLDSDRTVTASITLATQPTGDVRATVEATSIVECDRTNNDAAAALIDLRARDPHGLFDRQQYLLNSIDVNAAPTITSTPITRLEQGRAYPYQLTATDSDRGDAVGFELIEGPTGLHLDGHDGRFYYDTLAAGAHTVRVRAIDLRGASADQVLTLTVLPNAAPTITSTPGLDAQANTTYQYAVTASDADSDALIYSLREAPLTMRIDAITGVVAWTPQITHVGQQPVTVVVSDGRGGEATQAFTLSVASTDGNHAPVFTSTASTTATSGSIYTYNVEATDADNDPITLTLTAKPAGMLLNEQTGVITWKPTFAQTGSHPIEIKADDYKGGIKYQRNIVVVSAPAQNVAPTIDSTPRSYGKAGREYRYDVVASDANGDALTYSVVNAPTGMTIDANGAVRWTPTSAGRHSATVRVADRSLQAEQTWNIDVLAADVALDADVTITPQPVLPGATLTINVQVTGAAAPVTLTGMLDGNTLTLSPTGTTQITAPTTVGEHTVVVTVTDGHDTTRTTEHFTVGDADTTDPVVTINAPVEGAQQEIVVLTAPTDVIASIADDHLEGWSLTLRERGAPSSEMIELARGTNTVSTANIGKIDPTRLQNGLWVLVLDAWDAAGNTGQASLPIAIEGDMKPGHYAISFADLSVPVAGIPVTVTRTYDTRQRHKDLDFGHGWNVDYQSVRLQEARTPGFGWQVTVTNSGPMGGVPQTCVRAALGNVVSVTMPDGKVEKFRAKAEPECTTELRLDYALVFQAMDGTHGTLKALDDATGRAQNHNLTDIDGTRLLNPNRYVYTSVEGQEFQLDQGFTVREIHEPISDQTVTFGHDGVVHSAGPSITFVRDAQDRIKKVIAPDLTELTYEYNAAGDLVAFVDAEGNRTQYAYNARLPHYLEDIIDPRGVRVSRNEYDDDGRLKAVIDADGKRIEYSRDIDGRTETVKDRNGHSTTFVYNERGDVIAETNAEGETTERSYDAYGNQLSEKDPLGRIKRWTYDAVGNVLTETDASGAKTTNAYGPYNQLVTVKDAANREAMRNFYRNRTVAGVVIAPGPLMGMTDANGLSTTMEYDPATGEVSVIKDPTQAATRMEYDLRGRKIADIDALGHRTTYTNDEMGRPLTQTTTDADANGSTITLTTMFEYDANGNVIETIHPDGSFTTTEYDGNGKPVKECDTARRCTTTTFDARGNVARITYHDGTYETKTYDANGSTLTTTDTAGKTTRYVYDKVNRLVETILPDDDANDVNNPRLKNVYDEAGQLIESIDANGSVMSFEYDAAGRRTRTTLPAVGADPAATVVTEYDTTGRRIASINADGDRTEYVYDAGGRLIETVFDDGKRAKVEYDNAGRKTAEIDPMGRRTEYQYNALGQLTLVALAAGTPQVTLTTYTYDARGNKLTQTDAEGRVTRWEYDGMGREIARILPNTERETKSYNTAGELTESTDFNGETTRYIYDTMGRPKTLDYPQGHDISYGYDARGQRTSVIDGRGTSTSAYDAQGRILRSVDADGAVIECTYDAAGNMLTRISASQSLVYTYDARNRLSTVTRTIDGEAPSVTRYEYDQDGNRKTMIGGDGTRTEYGYDSRNRLRELVKKTAAGALLVAMSYQVDASGLRTAVEESDPQGVTRTVAWEYDALKRLTREAIDHRDNANDRVSSWTYDKVGNRLSQTVTVGAASAATTSTTLYNYDVNDRLLTETSNGSETRYAYDENGNTLTKTTGADVVEYAYDDANRLVELRKSGERVGYVYNADGLRVRQTVTPTGGTSTTTYYVQDATYAYSQVIEEWTQAGAGAKTLSAVLTFADDLVSQTRYAADGAPTTRYVQADGFGSTRWLTDATGSITDAIDYDAFGVEIGRGGTTNVEHLYRGERFDANAGLYDLRARLYSPSNGRFLTQDTFAGFGTDPRSLHKYLYAESDPVQKRDPSGHMSIGEQMAVQEINAILNVISRGERILSVYNKVNSAIELMFGIRQVIAKFRAADSELGGVFPKKFPPKLDFDKVAEAFVRGSTKAFGVGFLNWSTKYAAEYMRGKRLSAYVLYLPNIIGQPSRTFRTGARVNGKPLHVGVGGPGGKAGSLGGVGVVMGRERQLFRMDIGNTPAGHKGTNINEMYTFDEPPGSFHVYTFDGGPR